MSANEHAGVHCVIAMAWQFERKAAGKANKTQEMEFLMSDAVEVMRTMTFSPNHARKFAAMK